MTTLNIFPTWGFLHVMAEIKVRNSWYFFRFAVFKVRSHFSYIPSPENINILYGSISTEKHLNVQCWTYDKFPERFRKPILKWAWLHWYEHEYLSERTNKTTSMPINSEVCKWYVTMSNGGGEITQPLASLSVKWVVRVRTRLDPLASERWNSISVLLTRFHQCRRLVKKGRPCVIMSV